MQLLMRRPEIQGFISVAPPANMYDFSFLAPCPTSGLVLQGSRDDVVDELSVADFVDKIQLQKGISLDYRVMEGANHFFTEHQEELIDECGEYLDKRLGIIPGGIEETMLLR